MADWKGEKWIRLPMPAGKSDEVYALVTESLSGEEKRALAEYVAWYRARDRAVEGEADQ